MAGLLDPQILAFLNGGAGGSQQPGGAPSLGLLAPNGPQTMGLLGGGWQPQQGEGLPRSLVGDPRNPNDPRADALMAVGSGLQRGSLASGFDDARRVFADTEERGMRRASAEQQLLAGRMGLAKSALEIQQYQQAQERSQAIARDRARLRGGQAWQGLPTGRDSYGVPTVGDNPLFSMGSQPGTQAMGNAGMPQAGGFPQQPPQSYGGASAGGGQDQIYRQLIQEAQLYENNGDPKTALEYYQRAEQFKPKYSQTPQVMKDPRTGQLVNVVLGEDGSHRIVPLGVKPDIHLQELGGHVQAVDRNETLGGQVFSKSPTFADRNSAATLSLSRERFAEEQRQNAFTRGKPQIQEINGIPYQVVPGQAGAPASVRPLTGAEALAGDPKLTEAQGNATQFGIRMADATRTLKELESQGKNPWPSEVDRAGYKAEFPNWMPANQLIGSGLTNLNRKTVSDDALRYRQAQDNWITANLRKESGAAIPPAELEAERAKWFPLAGEGDETIKQKAAARAVAEEAMQVQMGPGRKQMRGALERTAPQDGGQAPERLPANPTPSNLQRGKTYQLRNGKAATWDGFQFRTTK